MTHKYNYRSSENYIAPGTIIHNDWEKAYGQIDPIYRHKTVNHSQHFVDLDVGVILKISNVCREICADLYLDIIINNFVHYLAEFMFKKAFDIHERLNAFFIVMAKGSTYKRRNSNKCSALKTQKLYKKLYKKIFCAILHVR